jgi:hypothetical protein
MNVRHTAEVQVTVKSGNRILSKNTVPVRLLDAHLSVESYCHGGGFGQANWHDPQGRPLQHAPKVKITLVNPDDVLAEGQECDCTECVAA